MPTRGLVLLAAVSLGICVLYADAAGQERQDTVLLKGRVVEEEGGAPIGAAGLTLRDHRGRIIARTHSDAQGGFSLVIRDAEGVSIRAERIGYVDNETPFLWFDGHRFFELEVRLDRDVILLAPLEVVARSGGGSGAVLADFRHRRARGTGVYFTRADIDEMQAALVTDLLARIPGVRLVSSGSGRDRVVEMGRAVSGRGCPVQVYVDGMHLTRGGMSAPIDEIVPLAAVHGVEVYRGLSTVPAEFLSPEARCGVIAIWTRRGGEE